MDTISKEIRRKVLDVYEYAKEITQQTGYVKNVEHLKDLMNKKPYKTINTDGFLREYLWVVFTCGFKADTVKKHWTEIKSMCCDFDISKTKQYSFDELLEMSPIKNKKKVKAVKKSCEIINDCFINKVHNIEGAENAKSLLKKLPFIGEVTVYHIMRNIGIDCFKPDRHIVNIKEELGISGEDLFNIILSECEEEFIGVVDHILWRAAATIHTLEPNSSLVGVALGKEEIEEIPKKINGNSKFLF